MCTDASGQYIGPIFKGQEVKEKKPEIMVLIANLTC